MNSLRMSTKRFLDQQMLVDESHLKAGDLVILTKLTMDSKEVGGVEVPADFFHALVNGIRRMRIPVASVLRHFDVSNMKVAKETPTVSFPSHLRVDSVRKDTHPDATLPMDIVYSVA
jgi:hypothetical protein